jgi:hypothetical protein
MFKKEQEFFLKKSSTLTPPTSARAWALLAWSTNYLAAMTPTQTRPTT